MYKRLLSYVDRILVYLVICIEIWLNVYRVEIVNEWMNNFVFEGDAVRFLYRKELYICIYYNFIL